MASYTDAPAISAYLAVTFTPEQAAQADLAAAAVTVWIDHRTGRTWQNASGSVVDEIHQINNGVVYLEYRPVLAVSEVHARERQGNQIGDWVLLDPSGYALVDPVAGRLEFAAYGRYATGADARVDYTSTVAAPPADIAYAATTLAADMLFPTLHPESVGLESLALGQNDISLRYARAGADGTSSSSGAAWAVRVIDAYRRVVLA